MTSARLFTPPLRELTPETTRGYEVAAFARDVLGAPLNPWQEWAAIHALELLPGGLRYRFRVILILAARQNGKSHLARVIKLWKLYIEGARLVLGVGQDLSLAREMWQGCHDLIKATPELAAELGGQRRTNGDEYLWLASDPDNPYRGLPRRYKISAATRSAGRGLTVDVLDFEELREQTDWLAWAALSKTTSQPVNAQTWCWSNAGDDESVVLNQLREAALDGRDPSLCLLEWSGPDDCELDDWGAIAQANPSLNHPGGITAAAIRSSMIDPPAVFRTEVLCQRVVRLDEAIPLSAWRDCADPLGSLADSRGKIACCVDVAPDGAHVTLCAAAKLGDGRVRVEVVDAWPGTEMARQGLAAALRAVRPYVVAWLPGGPAAALAPLFRSPERRPGKAAKHGAGAGGPAWEVVELRGAAVTEACQGLGDLARARRVLWPGDALLGTHIAGARRLWQGDGWRFARRGAGHVDAAYAAAGAAHVALTTEPPGKRRGAWVV